MRETGLRLCFGNRALTALAFVMGTALAAFYRFEYAGSEAASGDRTAFADFRERSGDPERKMEAGGWAVFQPASRTTGARASAIGIGNRFRLAGTFFSYSDEMDAMASFRRAILDDSAAGEQKLVKVGDRLEPGAIRVDRIESDHVILVSGLDSIRIGLGAPDSGPARSARPPAASAPAPGARSGPMEATPFGERVAEDRWEIRRDALLAYYAEMLDHPERVALLFQSFQPVYVEGQITGYRLGIEGEKDFLTAMGLQENDVIRTVNSENMTSRRRAEFFIREFVQGRADEFDLEFEREGRRIRQVYQIR